MSEVFADDITVLNQARHWLQAGQTVALATVIHTWGSSPRPPGSLLVMNTNGQYVGSLSGGCIEETLLERYQAGELTGPEPSRIDFGVDRQQASRMGLPCGGRLEVLIEHLSGIDTLEQLLQNLQNHTVITRRVDLQTGKVELLSDTTGPDFTVRESTLSKTFGPAWQLLLIGDGQLARHLASMSLQLDYGVIICDPRDEYSEPPLEHVRYTKLMPDDAVYELPHPARTAIITLSHDPRQDDLALSAAIETDAFYIGALGSRRSANARRDRLQLLGCSTQQLDRIHAPVGIDIGSKRPAEIAVSILAHITAVRNGMTTKAAINT